LTIPGVEGTERIAIGGYTDATSRRLVYLRRNQLASVAKVRTNDIARLTQGGQAYRDRTVFNIPSNRIERISLSTENQFADGRIDLTLERGQDGWTMTSPVSASVRADRIDKLTQALASLRAESIVASSGEPSAFGLNAPAARVTLTHKPPVEYRFEPPKGEEDKTVGEDKSKSGDAQEAEQEDKSKESDSLVPVEFQPPSKSMELLVTEHDGKLYAKRADGNAIFEVTRDFFQLLRVEYRTGEVLTFDESAVRQFSIRLGEQVHVFDKVGDRWAYQAEPDLPLDSKKVENLLLQLKDLKTERYVAHAAADLSVYGLTNALHEVTVTLEDATTHTLRVADQICNRDPRKGAYASVDGRSGVFLLTKDAVARFSVSLDDLEAG